MRNFSIWKSPAGRYLLPVLEGLACLTGGSLCLAGLLLLGSIPAPVMVWLLHLLWSISAFCAGRRAGLHGRIHGIQTGVTCGIILCIVLLCGCALLHETFTERLFLRCLFLLPAGAAGGVTGVNTKLKKPNY